MKILAALTTLLPFICFGASVVHTIDAPDTNISGLAWGDDKLWALDEGSSFIYGLDPGSGTVLESFEVVHTAGSDWIPAGLAYSNNMLFSSFVKGTYYSYIYFYDTTGNYIGNDPIC